jgi:hypothetical protein
MSFLSRVVKIGGDKSLNLLHLFEVTYSTFPEYYEKLQILGEPIQSQSGGANFPGIRSPTLVVLDVCISSPAHMTLLI